MRVKCFKLYTHGSLPDIETVLSISSCGDWFKILMCELIYGSVTNLN